MSEEGSPAPVMPHKKRSSKPYLDLEAVESGDSGEEENLNKYETDLSTTVIPTMMTASRTIRFGRRIQLECPGIAVDDIMASMTSNFLSNRMQKRRDERRQNGD
ncbi:hypothetical protein B0H14DRAFT_2655079 [Mycena olivaceomarginata]|nr:hypothetical protein B0H14DRAFT_2655079 [Mycena olivaceomarginata]